MSVSRTLIQASARAIPLANESVQTVVTSPPYWGLRQYAGEQREVWGGDAGCAHEWALTVRPARHSDDDISGSTLQGGKGTQAQAQRGDLPADGFCACGAWYGALGLEPTPELYVAHMVEVFREVRRVLRADGTLWLNLGDSYAGGGRGGGGSYAAERPGWGSIRGQHMTVSRRRDNEPIPRSDYRVPGIKPKDLVGIPWMVAFALRADGWYLRSDIIWHKPNPMPESVTDRPTKSHEYLFLLTKSERYYYDADAIREPSSHPELIGKSQKVSYHDGSAMRNDGDSVVVRTAHRNKRSVWTIATRPYPGAHFATFPEELVEPCVLAGSSPKACGVCGAPWERVTERPKPPEVDASTIDRFGTGDAGVHRKVGQAYQDWLDANPKETTGWRSTCAHEDDSGACMVLDPFNGSGTTGRVAIRHGRSYVGIDISREYLSEQATQRIADIQYTMPL